MSTIRIRSTADSTKYNGTNIRADAGSQYAKLGLVSHTWKQAELLRQNDDWLHIRYGGIEGYVHRGFVEVETVASPPIMADTPAVPHQTVNAPVEVLEIMALHYEGMAQVLRQLIAEKSA